jgi:hypothetical protein
LKEDLGSRQHVDLGQLCSAVVFENLKNYNLNDVFTFQLVIVIVISNFLVIVIVIIN